MKSKIFFLLSIFTLLILNSCKKCVDVDVPYIVEEPYTDTEKIDIKLDYNIKDNTVYYHRIGGAILLGENPKMEVYTTVTNTSNYGGTFKFYVYLSSQGNRLDFQTEEYISAGSTEKISIVKELNPYSFTANIKVEKWGVIAPTVSVDKEVTKYKKVTRYRKCNTCVEDCEGKYKGESEIPWWGYLIGGLILLGIIRGVLFD